MASFVDKLSFDRRASPMEEAEDVGRDGLLVHHHQGSRLRDDREPSPTLGELLKRVGAAALNGGGSETDGDGSSRSPSHHVLELSEMAPPPLHMVVTDIHQPFVLTFTDLCYSVKTAKRMELCLPKMNPLATDCTGKTKLLLDHVSGEAREGEILAVLGASGSGKSTLIDALANRIVKESLKGSVKLNGEDLDEKMMKVISAYVMQDDLLYPMLTVEETLMFAAEFRLPRSLSKSKKKARVQTVIDQLGLRRAAKTIIGDEGHRGVSGGERRRVSIGIDIVHDPIVLFLDEPTSGLDSTSAFMVVKVLQRIAQTGSIVVMSVHQPSFRIIGLLDQVLFLSRGQTVYRGPPEKLPLFFSEFGKPIPENENRAEFALDLIRELEQSPSAIKQLVEHNRSWQSLKFPSATTDVNDLKNYRTVPLKDAISASISRGKLVSGVTNTTSPASSVPKYANPFWVEMAVLTRRSFTNNWRTPELFAIRVGSVLVTGFLLATIFWRLDNTPKGAMERLGFFAMAMSTMFYTCADALPVFIQDRYIFMRETAYNAYRRSSYVLSNAIVGLPSLVLLSFAFAATTFFAVGLSGGAHGFFFFVAIIFASFWAGSSFVTFLSGAIPNLMLAYTVVVAILAYFLLFSGFFINRDRIPDYWIWFHYLSLVKYPYEAVLQNEFDDPTKCFVRGVQMFDNTPLGALPAAMKLNLLKSMGGVLGVSINSNTCISTGSDILRQQAVTQLSKWGCLWVTVAWGFLFRILFYFSLLFGSKNKRR